MTTSDGAHPRVAVATYASLPHLDDDGPRLLGALADAGVDAAPKVWDDPTVDWHAYDLVLLRTTWDYPLRRAEFVSWAQSLRHVANPADVVEWNTDKHYLSDLQAAGLPVISTVFLEPGDDWYEPVFDTADVVVKPVVSAGASHTGRFPVGDPAARELAERLLAEQRAVMVQPYLDAVDTAGETALLFLGGQFSHAVRKESLLTQHGERPLYSEQGYSETITAAMVTDAEVAVAERVLAAVPGGAGRLTYARVDLLPGADGAPRLLEVELTEPSLFLAHAGDEAMARLAADVVRRARAATGAGPTGRGRSA